MSSKKCKLKSGTCYIQNKVKKVTQSIQRKVASIENSQRRSKIWKKVNSKENQSQRITTTKLQIIIRERKLVL